MVLVFGAVGDDGGCWVVIFGAVGEVGELVLMGCAAWSVMKAR